MTTLTEVVRHPVVKREVQHTFERRRKSRLAQIPQPGNHRRQRIAGHALLVLPRRLEVAIALAATSASRTHPLPSTREHAIFGADRCVAVNPSDTAPP